MSDERDKGHIRKYSGPEKPKQTTEEYAQKHLNNSAFTNKVPANANSKVKTNSTFADGEPGSAENITPQTNTGENGGKKEGGGKKIKIVDKKENLKIPTFNESAETLTVKDTSQSPTVTAPSKEPPNDGTQTLARESDNKDMLDKPPEEGDDNGVIEFPNTLSADPTVSDPKTLAREDPNATKEKKEYDPKVDESFVPMNEEEEEKYQGKKQKEWKPSVTSQRILDAGLAGLNMFGNVLGGANKAFSMLRGLASALTSRQLMSDPTLPARGFLQAMDRSGQIVEDGIKQVGEAYGIKDGVKREDLVGTYKGGQYYKEKQAIEATEKDYYGKVGMALSDVLGNNVDVNDPVSIQNALSKMDASQLQDLNEKLFGQNGSLKGMYDGLMTASNPNKVQRTQAQLLQDLNKALKGQASDLSRQAGLNRSMANAQLRQIRIGRRQAQDMQQDRIADARRQMKDPASMAGMTPEEQMEVIIRGVLGRKIDNDEIPTTFDANGNEVIDTDALDIQDLNALSQALEGSPIYNDPATHDAADALYQEVRRRVEGAHEQRAQFRQQQRQSRINELMNYPLDYDIADKGGDRDSAGIPRSREGRRRLYNTAWHTMNDLIEKGGDQADINMCENIMFMCDLAGKRESAEKALESLFTSGAIDELERSHYMNEINESHRQAVEALAVTKADRDARIANKEDWTRGPATERAQMRLEAMETMLEDIRTGHMQQERDRRRQQEQARRAAQRSAELAPYQNSLIDMQMRSGRDTVRRDTYGIPMNRTSCRDLRDDAFAEMNRLISEGAPEEDVELCANVHALCNAALKRDMINTTIDRLEKAGKISKEDADLARRNAYNKYTALAERLPVTVDARERMIGAGDEWRQNTDTDMLAYDLDGTMDFLRGVEEDYDRGVRDERDAQAEQRRQERRARQERERQEARDRSEADRQARRQRRAQAEAEERARAEADREARDSAAEEAKAMRNNQWGISTSADPKFRRKDLLKYSDQLKRIEKDMADATSPDTMLALYKEKWAIEEKMRLTHQENHIQKALIDAGALPNAEEVRKQIEGLRGKYTDWNEFGKVLNELRTSNNMKYDTAWSTSRRLEEAQRAQARADAHSRKLDTMIDLMKEMISGQGSITNAIWGSSHQMFSEFEDYLDKKFRGQVQAMGRNRNLLIEEFQNFYTDTIKQDAKEALDGAVSAITGHMTNVCGDMEATIRGLSEDAQEKFLPMMQEVSGNTARLTRQLKGYYDGTNRDVQSILSTLNEQVSAMENLQATVKGMQPLGGQYVQDSLKIDKEQWEQLTAQFQDFDSYRQSVDDLIQAYKSQGQIPSADDLAKAITGSLAGYNPFQQSFEGDEEIRQMLKDLDTTRQKYDQIADNILAFNEGRAQFAVPVDFVDDWNEFQRWKAAGGQAQPQQEASPAPAPAPVPQQEDGRSVSDSGVPPAGAPTENEPYTEEKPVGAQDDTPYNADTEFDVAMDRLKEFPELQARLRENPEQIRAMYITDDHNIPIHQTFQNIMRRAVAGKLFGENTGPTIMQMADDLFGQTSNEGFRNARDDWYSIAQSEGTEKEKRDKVTLVTQMATIAGNALKDTFRETAEVNLGIASGSPTPLTGEQEAKERARIAREKSRDIRHFFKLMGEEGDWQTPPGQPQPKPRLTPEQKALQEQQYQQARQDKTDFILGRPSSDAEKRISDMVKDRLFYSKGRPTWKDYDELLTDLENEGTPEATKAYESIINRAVLPRLFTLQNNGGAKESGAELQQLVDKAMELGRSGTNRAQAQHFDTKGIVEHMLKGPSSNRTTNGAWNNSFKRAFEAAREWKDLDSRIQSLIDKPDSEGAISKFGPQVQGFLADSQKDLNEIAEKLKNNGFQNAAQVNKALNKLKAMQSKASKLNTDIGVVRDKIPTTVHGKLGTSKEIPEESLNRIREVRRALAESLTPKGELKEFLAGGKYDKMAQELKEKKYNFQLGDIKSAAGVDDVKAKEILDKIYIEEDPDKTFKEFLTKIEAEKEAEKKGKKNGGKNNKGANPAGTGINTKTDTTKADEERIAQSKQKFVDFLKMTVRGNTRDEQLNGLKARYTRDAKKLNEDAGMLGLRSREESWEPTDENIAKIADAVWGNPNEITSDGFGEFL